MTDNRLQAAARVALIGGAIGSLVMMFLHGRPSVFLLILFTGWVLAPFIGLAWADRLSSRWPPSSRTLVHYLMIFISVGSLAIYVYDVASAYKGAFLFVAVPMIAWVLVLITIPIAVLAGRRSSRTRDV
ncbi:MAG TPA: hypothetical protein VGU74_10520 [Gemmatimonadales bacterium]|nr:hypothetical protein [Gemmatimonadales bacterium]